MRERDRCIAAQSFRRYLADWKDRRANLGCSARCRDSHRIDDYGRSGKHHIRERSAGSNVRDGSGPHSGMTKRERVVCVGNVVEFETPARVRARFNSQIDDARDRVGYGRTCRVNNLSRYAGALTPCCRGSRRDEKKTESSSQTLDSHCSALVLEKVHRKNAPKLIRGTSPVCCQLHPVQVAPRRNSCTTFR